MNPFIRWRMTFTFDINHAYIKHEIRILEKGSVKRILAALAEDLGLVPSTYMAPYNCQ